MEWEALERRPAAHSRMRRCWLGDCLEAPPRAHSRRERVGEPRTPGRFSATLNQVQLTIRLLRETDGRWIADVPELPGATVYGASAEEATLRAKALALRVIAEEIEHGEMKAPTGTLQFSVAA